MINLNVLLPNVDTLTSLQAAQLPVESQQFLLHTQQKCGLDGISELFIALPDKLKETDPSYLQSKPLVRKMVKSVPGWRSVSPSIRLNVFPKSDIEKSFRFRHPKLSVMHGVRTPGGLRLELLSTGMPWYVKDLPSFLKCDTDNALNCAVKDWLPTTADTTNNLLPGKFLV